MIMMKKIWFIFFAVFISLNQTYALSCEAACDVMEISNHEAKKAHDCCPSSKDKENQNKSNDCMGHKLHGKCFHEDTTLSIQIDGDKVVKKHTKNLIATGHLIALLDEHDLRNRPLAYKNYQKFKIFQLIYLYQEKFLI